MSGYNPYGYQSPPDPYAYDPYGAQYGQQGYDPY